ncbi:MAG: GAF domain-containing protein [Deltaproteobacteria bacterium]|nr:GAF domain-containing protein [Deltaproteobacteria bacterium]
MMFFSTGFSMRRVALRCFFLTIFANDSRRFEAQTMSKAETLTGRRSFMRRVPPGLLQSFWDLLPSGESLPADVWQSRHRFLLRLTWSHALLIALIGPVLGYSWELSFHALFRDGTVLHTLAEGSIVGFFASIATLVTINRAIRATAVGFGLVSASAILVHLSGGYIELHFHFFVVLAFLALYQDRVCYLLAIVYVALHHGVVGAIWPQHVYNHTAAINAPWTWGAIHALFVLCAAAGSVIAWRFNEKAFAQTKLILDSAGEGIFGLDREAKIIFINPAAASFLHCQANEAIGKAIHQVLRHTRPDGSEFSKQASPILGSLKDGAKRQVSDELFWRLDGTSFPVEYKCTPIVDRESLAGAVVTFTDITTRKQREVALRESEERFRQIAENIKEVFWITDPLSDKKLYVSPAYREVWGRDPAKIASLSQSWLGLIHAEDLSRVLVAVRTKQVTGQYDEEYRIVRPDGSVRWIKDRAFPVRDESGNVYRIIGLAGDITERKQSEEDLRSRYNEVAILHEVSQMILGAMDLEPVLAKILRLALATLSLDLGNIRLFEPIGGLRVGVHRGYHDPENIRAYYTDMKNPRSDVLSLRVIASGKSLVLQDLATADGLPAFKKEEACSAIVVPIVMETETLGLIEVGSRTSCTFRPGDVRLLEAIGNQVGIAVQKARLLRETERRAQEQEALNVIAEAVSQSLRTDELLKIALEKVFEVTGRERVSIRLKDSNTGGLTLVAHRGFSPEEVEELLRTTSDSSSEEIFATGQPRVVNNSSAGGDSEALLPQSDTVSLLPIKAGANVVGIMGVSAGRPIRFELREIALLEAIGNMIGVALENARLFSETEARYRELQILQAISQTILGSSDLKGILSEVLDKAYEIGGFDIGVIRIFDQTGEILEPAAMRGYRAPKNVADHRKVLEGLTSGSGTQEALVDKAVHVVDLNRSPGMRTFRKEGVRTAVVVPLRSYDNVLGIIHLGNRSERVFAQRELQLLEAIGDQAGIAIQKAGLYEESRRAQASLEEKAAELARSNIDLQHFSEEIKIAKEKLERVNSVLTVQAAELARSNTELEQFAYVASHDLQEPLRMVASYVQLLARRYKGKLDAEAEEFIGFAVDGSKRMQDLIIALLAYSRIGTKTRELAPTECEAVLQITLKNLQIAIDDSQATITHGPLPTVMADATQLGQLFQNLIGNAIKFRGDKRPAVHVSAEQNGKEWLFSFRDDGIGIDPQYAERIFVIFQRLHSKEEYPGTGIGLALCKKIVERHGGRIWLESEPGKGSTFRFTLLA